MTSKKTVKGRQSKSNRKVSDNQKADAAGTGNSLKSAKRSSNNSTPGTDFSSTEERLRKIQELAYLKAEKRHFEPGHELEDWLEAEKEVDAAARPLPGG